MTEQKKKVIISKKYLDKFIPYNFKPETAIITNSNYKLPSYLKILKKINLNSIPPAIDIKDDIKRYFIFAKFRTKSIIIINGRYHFYEGATMRELGHYIYLLKVIGIRKIISIDEVANLNPRFKPGEIALVYDQINLMGDNPLIGENDETLGIRFPDMSNAYSSDLFNKAYKIFQNLKIKINESVYLGLIGPESETEAEARFYREIGSDIAGYSLIPENISAVHSGIKFSGICMITRDIIADKIAEDNSSEKEKQFMKSKSFKKAKEKSDLILKNILSADF
ncbi:MAG: purine-nucleoside phosphorylase [Ignavibacteria bacterium]|nr:purine-nucleoside phosphorylase [Ignavibacteria bacterium]